MIQDPFAKEATVISPPGAECWPTVMVTGHRPQHLTPGEVAWSQVALHRTAWRLRSVYGTQVAVTGLAIGADTWWALAALAAGMRLHAYIPFPDQYVKWNTTDQEMWHLLRAKAAEEFVLGDKFDTRLLHARNTAMLRATQEADGLVLALYKPGTSGGTKSAVEKARAAGLPLLVLDPTKRTITREGW